MLDDNPVVFAHILQQSSLSAEEERIASEKETGIAREDRAQRERENGVRERQTERESE